MEAGGFGATREPLARHARAAEDTPRRRLREIAATASCRDVRKAYLSLSLGPPVGR